MNQQGFSGNVLSYSLPLYLSCQTICSQFWTTSEFLPKYLTEQCVITVPILTFFFIHYHSYLRCTHLAGMVTPHTVLEYNVLCRHIFTHSIYLFLFLSKRNEMVTMRQVSVPTTILVVIYWSKNLNMPTYNALKRCGWILVRLDPWVPAAATISIVEI